MSADARAFSARTPWDEVDTRGLPFGKALAKIELNKND
jgi:hypothetical protein